MKLTINDINSCEYIASHIVDIPSVYCVNNTIYITEDPNSPNYALIQEWGRTNTITNRYQSEEDLQQAKDTYDKSVLVNTYIQYLNDTDWVVTKINEAQVLGQDIQPLLDKYAYILTKRQEAREGIQ